ncbi:MAG: hypothetical protein ACI9BC_002085, partial [Crocinitomicaceae bacterium]
AAIAGDIVRHKKTITNRFVMVFLIGTSRPFAPANMPVAVESRAHARRALTISRIVFLGSRISVVLLAASKYD